MSVKDKSLSFGLQNFIWVKEDTSDGTYDYNGFQNLKATTVILRTNKAGTLAEYYVSYGGNFNTIWAAKGTKTYRLPVNLNE
jgi:hypothetical protein